MQQAQDSLEGTTPPSSPRRALNPLPVFLAIAAVVTLGVASYFLLTSSNDPPATELGPPKDAFALTDQEAIAEWESLHDLWLRSYRERDASLVETYAAPDAPTLSNPREVNALLRRGVLDKTRFFSARIAVILNSNYEINIREKVRVFPRFVDEKSGKDVTVDGVPELQTVVWTMRLYGSDWKLYRSVITSARPLSNVGDER